MAYVYEGTINTERQQAARNLARVQQRRQYSHDAATPGATAAAATGGAAVAVKRVLFPSITTSISVVRSSSQQQQGQEELGVERTDGKGDENQRAMTEVEPSRDTAVVEKESTEDEEKQQAHEESSTSSLSVPEAVTATISELLAELERQENAPRLFIFTGFEEHRRPMATTDASDAADGQTARALCGESAVICFDSIHLHLSSRYEFYSFA
eukprot:COSAG05_NODE_224_length_13609_cov_26.220429_15_plen_212_part_00